ncbi:MAG: hypothetical protein RJA16_1018 [Planctomycetota bacterium]
MTLLAAANATLEPAIELLPSASEGGPFKFLTGGGVVGVIILLLSLAAAGLAIALFVRIRAKVLVPPASVEALREMLVRGRPEEALEYCLLPEHDSFL